MERNRVRQHRYRQNTKAKKLEGVEKHRLRRDAAIEIAGQVLYYSNSLPCFDTAAASNAVSSLSVFHTTRGLLVDTLVASADEEYNLRKGKTRSGKQRGELDNNSLTALIDELHHGTNIGGGGRCGTVPISHFANVMLKAIPVYASARNAKDEVGVKKMMLAVLDHCIGEFSEIASVAGS